MKEWIKWLFVWIVIILFFTSVYVITKNHEEDIEIILPTKISSSFINTADRTGYEILSHAYCKNYKMEKEFRETFSNESVNSFKNNCITKKGIYSVGNREISCDYNTVVERCDSSQVKAYETFCNEMGSDFYCDNEIGFIGCLCYLTPPTE